MTVTYTDEWGGSCPYNALCLKTAEPITAAGTYTFVLKKEYAYTDAGVRLTEDITYKFTLVEGLKITGSTPADGAEVEAIEEILIEFNQDIICYAEAFMLAGDNGEEHYLLPAETAKDGSELPFNVVRIVAETPITAAGTYTLYINEWTIVNSSWETLSEQTLTFTIPGAAGGEGEGEETATYYRIKTTTATGDAIYLNIGNTVEHQTGPIGGVNVVAYAEDDNQLFAIEDAGNGMNYLKSKSGYYIKGWAWNVDGSADQKTELEFEDAGEGAFYIKCSTGYFKVEWVEDAYYPFCDAAFNLAVKWTLEEDGAATAIEGVETEVENTIYDLTGRKIETITKAGIYIVNGKKVLVK